MTHPALSLLLIVGLIQFWLMPGIAWLLLKGQRDLAARFWFAGTACYAGAASLFVLQTLLPTLAYVMIGLVLVSMMLALIAEALRREISSRPTPWGWITVTVVGNAILLVSIQQTLGDNAMRLVQLVVVSAMDLGCCYLLIRVVRAKKSRALVLVVIGFLAVVITNVLRVYGFLARGEAPTLLTFTSTSNLGFIANYLSVVIYSFGYWGFVIEKNRAALRSEIAERERAQQSEFSAIDRERTTLELVRQRETLIAELARMQRAAQAGALSASIAHEINQPLATIRLCAEEALRLLRSGGDPARLDQLIGKIAEESQRAAGIIRTLRDIFRGHQSGEESRTVDATVGATVALLERRAREIGARIHTDLRAPVRARIGAGELDHVILNLISNALDAMAEWPQSRRNIEISTAVRAHQAVIQVRDYGPGVAESMRGQLFDLFARSQSDGIGLGLWLSRFIVERREGAIQFEPLQSEPGACFSVTLNLSDPPA